MPSSTLGALDYDNIEIRPVRGATVDIVGSGNTALVSTKTNALGEYSVNVDQNTLVSVRVSAQLEQDGDPSWDFKVTDNTNGNAQYVMQGSQVSSGTENAIRDLHASSGWTGSSYGEDRVAAPFAILDNVYDAVQLILAEDPTVNFTPSELRWSTQNTAVSGNLAQGLIGTSFYSPSEDNMYILGDADNDTDEYDRSVILHEWAHYFEDTLSRSDSIGGAHSISGAYDMRLAFGEGFANAFSGIAGNTEFYRDSAGAGQALGFSFSMEQNNFGNLGWYSENSVAKIVLDIADQDNDGNDTLSEGFSPIYQALTSDDYISSTALTSIYLFSHILKDNGDSAMDAAIDALMQGESIFGEGIYGAGETNQLAANLSFILPVYHTLSIGGTVNVCSSNSEEEYNGVAVRRFIRVSIASSGSRTITVTKTSGAGDRDPDFIVSRGDESFRQVFESSVVDSETGVTSSLSAGEYIIEVYDYLNVDGDTGGGESCFNVTIN